MRLSEYDRHRRARQVREAVERGGLEAQSTEDRAIYNDLMIRIKTGNG